MIVSKRIGPYAKALYELGLKENCLKDWLEFLSQMDVLLKQHPQLMDILSSPLAPLLKKKDLLKRCFESVLPRPLFQFCQLLLSKGHFEDFSPIFDQFKSKVFQKWGWVEGTLTTPYPIEEDMKKNIIDQWEKILKKQIVLHQQLDPNLIGGGILKLNDNYVDFSLKGKLEKLKRNI